MLFEILDEKQTKSILISEHGSSNPNMANFIEDFLPFGIQI